MPSELSLLGVYNLALDHIVETPLSSLTEDSPYQRWLTRNFSHLRDVLLRGYPWNFATQFNTLSEDSATPPFRWAARYTLPPDWLRVLPPTYLGNRGGKPIPYEVVGNYLYTDQRTTLYVRTVQRVEDLDAWDTVAIDALALSVAIRMTYRFTGKDTHRDRLIEELKGVLAHAREIDTLEGSTEPVEQHDVIDIRDS